MKKDLYYTRIKRNEEMHPVNKFSQGVLLLEKGEKT